MDGKFSDQNPGYDYLSHIQFSNEAITITMNASYGNTIICREEIPSSGEFFKDAHFAKILIVLILACCVITNIAIYIEEIFFFMRHFSGKVRKQKTIYVLALAPMFSVCGMLGVLVPRAGILVDMVANSYLAMVLYSLMCLLDDYLGGRSIATTSGITSVSMATPPCCCCCVCLPRMNLNKKSYRLLMGLVYQTTIVRPLLVFLSAVLWLDGVYVVGRFTVDNPYVYISALNLCSSMTAVWVLIVIQRSFRPVLARFRVVLKFLYIQLTLLGTILGNITITVLVSKGVIPCTEFIPSKTRAGRIYHSFVIVWMFIVTCWGRYAYRTKSDGARLPDVEFEHNPQNGPCECNKLEVLPKSDSTTKSSLQLPRKVGHTNSFVSIQLDDEDVTAL